jgi:hypothetical protein
MKRFLAFLCLFVLSAAAANAAFNTVDCSDAGHIATLGIPQAECEVLEIFWDSTNGPGWTDNTNWDTLTSAQNWIGVNNFPGRVAVLSLPSNNLSGLVPAELGILTELVRLQIDHNQLSGPIPIELGNLINLVTLDLNNNQLTGSIPTALQNLVALTRLTVGVNALEGRIPDLTGLSVLRGFGFAGNRFDFSDFEPEFPTYRAQIAALAYTPQSPVDTGRVDSFTEGQILTITPQLAANPSGNDVYQWRKDGVIIPGPAGSQRIYTKTATLADAGLYWYSVTNTVVTGAQLNATISTNIGITISVTPATTTTAAPTTTTTTVPTTTTTVAPTTTTTTTTTTASTTTTAPTVTSTTAVSAASRPIPVLGALGIPLLAGMMAVIGMLGFFRRR